MDMDILHYLLDTPQDRFLQVDYSTTTGVNNAKRHVVEILSAVRSVKRHHYWH